MSPILKLDDDDPKREMEFEIDFQATLTTRQRFDMMCSASSLILETLIRNGHRRPVEIAKRT